MFTSRWYCRGAILLVALALLMKAIQHITRAKLDKHNESGHQGLWKADFKCVDPNPKFSKP